VASVFHLGGEIVKSICRCTACDPHHTPSKVTQKKCGKQKLVT